ncbi:hypothetical protein [Pontibacterium sp.]|uniref:hypothetical protein n=1 Tax=Pontibacterium sp. TaxID=2036026 RepID=UPI0035139BF0
MSNLLVNDVIESVKGEAPFDKPARILWIDRDLGDVTLLTIETPPKRPWTFGLEELMLMLRSEALQKTKVRTPAFMLDLESDLPAHAIEVREKNWARIQPLVETVVPGEIFFPGMLGTMVSMHATKTNIQRKTLYRLLYRYWMYGGVRNALLSDRTRRGNPGGERAFVRGKTPGRPARYLGETVSVKKSILTEQDKENIRNGYALYAKNQVKSISDAYQKTIRRFYRAEHPSPGEIEDDVVLKPLDELPSERQFLYWGKKAFDDMTVLRGRRGEKRWAKDHRALAGRAGDGLFGPCHRFEIDATVADIYLVSRYRRDWIIGRPVVYIVVDVFSGMIAGLFVGLEGPSWDGARHALFNAFTDKVAFCKAHDIDISEDEWPCHHLPQEIMADRAELLSQAAERALVNGLKVDLAAAGPYRPDWKAIVESRFKILNNISQVHWTPGGVRARELERGDRDVRLDATLNLGEFTQILIVSILHYNRHNRQPYRLSAEMIKDRIEPAPMEIWNWGVGQGIGQANNRSVEEVYLHLLPSAEASVQAGGINFRGMFYTSEYALAGNWFARARNTGRKVIRVWYSPWSTEFIWIQGDNKEFHKCTLRASEDRYRGYRLEEVIDMLAIVEPPSPRTRFSELNSRVRVDEQIEATIKKSKKAKADSGISASKRIEGIRTNRKLEKELERERLSEPIKTKSKKSHKTTESAKGKGVANSYAGERSAQVIDLLGKIHQNGEES